MSARRNIDVRRRQKHTGVLVPVLTLVEAQESVRSFAYCYLILLACSGEKAESGQNVLVRDDSTPDEAPNEEWLLLEQVSIMRWRSQADGAHLTNTDTSMHRTCAHEFKRKRTGTSKLV